VNEDGGVVAAAVADGGTALMLLFADLQWRCAGGSRVAGAIVVLRCCFRRERRDATVVAGEMMCAAAVKMEAARMVCVRTLLKVCEQGKRRLNCGGVAEVAGICAICGGVSEEDARNWCRFVVAGCVNGGCRSCAVVCGLSFTVARWWFVCGRLRWCVAGEGGTKEEDGWWLPWLRRDGGRKTSFHGG